MASRPAKRSTSRDDAAKVPWLAEHLDAHPVPLPASPPPGEVFAQGAAPEARHPSARRAHTALLRRLKDRRQKAFLRAFAVCGNVTKAAETVGMDRDTHYLWLQRDPAYAATYPHVEAAALDILDAELYRRGVLGVHKPVYQQGLLVGYVQEYSDRCLEILAKARDPEKYRERIETTGSVTVGPAFDLSKLTDAELVQWQELAAKAMPTPAPTPGAAALGAGAAVAALPPAGPARRRRP
jgi:hypothetical protein